MLLVFFFVPLVNILVVMFKQAGTLQLRAIWNPLSFTIYQAVLSTLLTLLLGLPVAFVVSRYSFPGRGLVRILSVLPFILPTVVVAAAFNALLGPRGWLNLAFMQLSGTQVPPIHFLNTFTAILVAHVFYNISIVIRIVGSAWSQLDPRLENSARVLGASPWRAFLRVTLPLLRKSLLVAALLVFLFDFTSFGVILLLGGVGFSTLEVAIYTQALSMLNLPMAGLLSIIQLVCTLLITILYSRISGKQAIPIFPLIREDNLRKPSRKVEKIVIALVITFLVLLQVLPLLGVFISSVTRLELNRGERAVLQQGLTLSYYRELFINKQQSIFYVPPFRALGNSLYYALITMVISVSLGTLLAYALVKHPGIHTWLDPVVMLPFGASAVTLGLGFIITFSRPPFDPVHFRLLVPLAHSLIAMPFVVRAVQPALVSIPPSLLQSAALLGASPWQLWWQVEMRLIRSALLAGGIFSFAISLGEFGATTFISRPENPTMPVAIYRYLSQPGGLNYGQAMAMSSILILVCLLSVLLLEKLSTVRHTG
jgi:thiamine transport system permease protein